MGTISRPEIIWKCRTLAVATRYPSSSAVTPIRRSERAMRMPLAVFSPCPESHGNRYQMDRQCCHQFVQELLPCGFSFRCVGASHSVREFDQCNHRDGDILASHAQGDTGKSLARSLALAFCSNQYARIKDQSHAGGFNGSRWASTAAATSLAKSSSMVALESAGSREMHSSIDRRGGRGACRTATGRASDSITISAPARTRASRPAKSRAAS